MNVCVRMWLQPYKSSFSLAFSNNNICLYISLIRQFMIGPMFERGLADLWLAMCVDAAEKL